jgi:hypothetical protein
MTISIALVICSVIVLLLLVRLAKGQHIVAREGIAPADQVRYVDIRAFRNLIDPNEEEYLRSRLPAADFRKIQRERIWAATDYISCAAHNAALLLNLANAARHSPDPEIVASATRLIDNAIQLRLYALQAIPKLYIALLFPVGSRWHVALADRYETMVRQVVLLGLRYPAGGISSLL